MTDWLWPDNSTPILIAQATEHGETAHGASAAPAAEAAGEHHEHSQWWYFGYSMIAFIIIVLLIASGVRRLRLIPRGLQNFMELIVEMLYGIAEMVMGPRGRQYAPFVSTFFLYILVMNLSGLFPGLQPGTASLSITLGMAIVAFFAVQYFGFRAHGLRYVLHFAGPVWWMFFLILPLELLSELIRPVSLSFRLYGNIFGEEQVFAALATNFGPLAAVLLLPLQVLTSILQALVFTLLVTVYISLATEKHQEHETALEDAEH